MILTPTLREAFEAGYAQGHDATVEGRYVDPSDAATDYLAALFTPEPQGWRPMSDVPPPGQYIAALAGGMVLPLYWSGTYWTGGMTRDCKQPVAWMPFPSFQIAQGEEP